MNKRNSDLTLPLLVLASMAIVVVADDPHGVHHHPQPSYPPPDDHYHADDPHGVPHPPQPSYPPPDEHYHADDPHGVPHPPQPSYPPHDDHHHPPTPYHEAPSKEETVTLTIPGCDPVLDYVTTIITELVEVPVVETRVQDITDVQVITETHYEPDSVVVTSTRTVNQDVHITYTSTLNPVITSYASEVDLQTITTYVIDYDTVISFSSVYTTETVTRYQPVVEHVPVAGDTITITETSFSTVANGATSIFTQVVYDEVTVTVSTIMTPTVTVTAGATALPSPTAPVYTKYITHVDIHHVTETPCGGAAAVYSAGGGSAKDFGADPRVEGLTFALCDAFPGEPPCNHGAVLSAGGGPEKDFGGVVGSIVNQKYQLFTKLTNVLFDNRITNNQK